MTTRTPERTVADRAIEQLGSVIDSLTPADLARQSPCPGWKVSDVLAHIAGTAAALADFARTGQRELPDHLRPLDDPIAQARQAIRDVHAALDSDSESAGRAAFDVAVEFTTHAWDLDTGTAIPEDLAADVHGRLAPLMTEDLRQQFFGPEVWVAADASACDRLLGFLGRDPAAARKLGSREWKRGAR